MFKYLKISMIRFPKLFIHSILLMVILTFLAFLSADIAGWIIGRPIEESTGFVTLIMIIWFFFALQSEKYKKQSVNK